jgi:tRNA(Ile)-lysidine synthase
MTADYSWFSAALSAYRHCQTWFVAYSGGLDSSVLLKLLVDLRAIDDSIPALQVIHVNHGLSANAHQWQKHCIETCEEYDVPLSVFQVDIEADLRLGVEAAARKVRYGVFERQLAKTDVLLMAHHLDDQLETFFLRLFRGAGIDGLTSIPQQRSLGQGQLVRPLLGQSRASLEKLAEYLTVSWVDDESNTDTRFDRNFLRHELIPVIEKRWPAYRQTMSRTLDHLQSSRGLLSAVASEKLACCESVVSGQPVLLFSELVAAGTEQASLTLRSWLKKYRFDAPRSEQIKEFLQQLQHSDTDAQPRLSGHGYELRRYDGGVYLLLPETEFDESLVLPLDVTSPGTSSSVSVLGVGQLSFKAKLGKGIKSNWNKPLSISFRRGGERCQPVGRAHSQSLKKLFQEYKVEPWWRDRVPLIYTGGDLMAVGDYWVCEGTWVSADEEGFGLAWQRPGIDIHD